MVKYMQVWSSMVVIIILNGNTTNVEEIIQLFGEMPVNPLVDQNANRASLAGSYKELSEPTNDVLDTWLYIYEHSWTNSST